MGEPRLVGRLCRRWLGLVGHLVPASRRRDWRAEWEGEITVRELDDVAPATLLRDSAGALPDAVWYLIDCWSDAVNLDLLRTDLRHSLRGLLRQPAFALLAVSMLALGIGATTAIYSLVDGIALRPLPFPQPERLVALWESNPEKGWVQNQAAPANVLDWRQRVEAFAGVGASGVSPVPVALGGEVPEVVQALSVTPSLFPVLGVTPLHGRGFHEEEMWRDPEAVGETPVVLSERLWRSRFAADPEVLGESLLLNGNPATVVGVMPRGFRFRSEVDLWLPFQFDPADATATWFRRAHFVWPVARLRSDATLDQASAQLEAVAAQLAEEYPATNRVMGAGLTPLQDWVVGDSRRSLLVLLAAVGVMLLVTCANVAGLLLVRASKRSREVAVRASLGAPRWRLARQLLLEGLWLATVAGAAGLVFAKLLSRILLALAPADLPRLTEVALDWRVMAISLALTVGATLLFGVWPAAASSRVDLRAVLGSMRSAALGRRERRHGRLLVVAEVALAAVLLFGASLATRGLVGLLTLDPGLEPERVTVARLRLPSASYPDAAAVTSFWERLEARVAALPEVRSAAVATRFAFVGTTWTSDYSFAGLGEAGSGRELNHREVTPELFRTAGIPLLAGRPFRDADDAAAAPVVIVSESLARRHFADLRAALGQRLSFDPVEHPESRWYEIVGVVGDTHFRGLGSGGGPEVYVPFAQDPSSDAHLIVASDGDAAPLIEALRVELRRLDPTLPFVELTSLERAVADTVAVERFTTFLLAVFAALALLLAAVGTYGVLAFAVSARRAEIGLRMALGADRRRVLSEVLQEGMGLILAGWGIGLAAAWALQRWLAGALHGIGTYDLATCLVASLLLFAIGLVACLAPALRAAALDPVRALHSE